MVELWYLDATALAISTTFWLFGIFSFRPLTFLVPPENQWEAQQRRTHNQNLRSFGAAFQQLMYESNCSQDEEHKVT